MSGPAGGLRLAVFSLLIGMAVDSDAATKDVRTVVAQVGAEWTDEVKLRAFHAELVQKFKDAPSFEEMVSKTAWVVVVDVHEAKRAHSVAARAEAGANVKKGDIVEVSYRIPRTAQSFFELPSVRRVVCSAGSPTFDECRKRTEMGAFDSEGKRTGWGD